MFRALVIVALLGLAPGCSDHVTAPPTLLHVPDFTLTDQAGQPLRARDLDGKIWIADFFFTSCPTICPVLTTQLKNLSHRLGDHGEDLRIVSFSVDPRTDTPETLSAYAQRFSLDTRHWSLLTGPPAEMRRVVESFRVAMGEPQERQGGGYDIVHDTHFVLVDRTRHLRGYYSHDGDGIDRLVRDASYLLNE